MVQYAVDAEGQRLTRNPGCRGAPGRHYRAHNAPTGCRKRAEMLEPGSTFLGSSPRRNPRGPNLAGAQRASANGC